MSLLLNTTYARADALPEFRLKAAFIYNFIAYTEWPNGIGSDINLCVYGENSFGHEISALDGRNVNDHLIKIQNKNHIEDLLDCQVIFIADSVIENLPSILGSLDTKPILTIADSKNAANEGVALNMGIAKNKIIFEANLKAARRAGLTLSARLLRLATKVYQ